MAARFRAAIDGGSRGNPGKAAWGVALLDDDGACREGYAGVLGHATNNVAEYNGLLHALRIAREREARRVQLFADSELIVKQILGHYRVRHPDLKPLHAEAMRLIAGFDSFAISHVRRDKNKEADRLVNVALDRFDADSGNTEIRVHEVNGAAIG